MTGLDDIPSAFHAACPPDAPCVAVVTEAFSGGVARQLAWAAATLPALGWRLHFFLSPNRAHETAVVDSVELARPGVTVERLPMRRGFAPWSDVWAYRQLRRRLAVLRPAVVHTHSAKAGLLGRWAARRLGIPAVHTPHVLTVEWARGPWRRAYAAWERRAGDGAWMVCLNAPQAALAVREGLVAEERGRVIPNGVDTDAFPPVTARTPAQRRAARTVFGVLEDDRPVVGVAARMAAQKGPDVMLEAMRRIARAHPTTRFLVAGEGALSEVVRDRAYDWGLTRDGVLEFVGDRRDMAAFYGALDIFMLSSWWEGMPYALLEAQSSGLPVVATATRGAEACVDSGRNGLLVPVGDAEALARAVVGLIRDPGRAERLGEAAAASVRVDFPLSAWARSMDALYRAMLADAASSKEG